MNSPSPPSATDSVTADCAVIACGALSADIAVVAQNMDWMIDVFPLPPLLHNHPERIAGEVSRLLDDLIPRYAAVAVAYADCGSYGAIDTVCEERRVPRLAGSHCYDVYAGVEHMRAIFAAEPGTYVLTDFLAMSFERTVIAELGLDRYPELRDDYFGNYTRVVWLAGRHSAATQAAAEAAADRIGLPLEIVNVGLIPLTEALTTLRTNSMRGH